MATIIREARDPWWANLAVNVLGGLWNDYQQREANKKANAYIGEFMNQLQTLGNSGQQSATPSQGAGQGLFSAPDNDTNGWASAFHKTDNPLTQYDTGVMGLLGASPTPATTPTATPTPAVSGQGASLPTAADIYRAAMGLAGTKRFAMMNPETVQKMITPYMQMNEQARQEQIRNTVAQDYMNATDSTGRKNVAASALLRQIIGNPEFNSLSGANAVTPMNLDLGGSVLPGTFDTWTGQTTYGEAMPKTLTPQQVAENAYRDRSLAATIAHNNATLDLQREQIDRSYDIQNRTLEQNNRPMYSMQAINGKMYWADPRTGTVSPVMHNGEHLNATPNAQGAAFTEADKQVWNTLNAEANDLQKEIDRLEKRHKEEYREDEKQKLNTLIAELRAKLVQKRRQAMEYITGRMSTRTANQSSGSNEQYMPPVAPPVRKYISQQEYQSYIRDVESGRGIKIGGKTVKTREELDKGLRSNGIVLLEGSKPNAPAQPQTTPISGDVLAIPQTASSDIPATPISPDVTPLGNNDIPVSPDVSAVDSNATRNALDALNEDFGNWGDYAERFNPQDFLNNFQPSQAYPGRYQGNSLNGGQYSGIINRQAKIHNIDPDLIAAIIQQESGGNYRAVSPTGAQGLMQLMPETARGLGVANSFDPEQNIAGGVKYFAQMLKRYNGNIEKALWAYNAGPGNADKGRLPAETRKYIPSVMARYRRLKSGNIARGRRG